MVAAVVIRNGSRDERGGTLEKGTFYGSEKENGRRENYHAMEFNNLDVSKYGPKRIRLIAKGVSKHKRATPFSCTVAISEEKTNFVASERSCISSNPSVLYSQL